MNLDLIDLIPTDVCTQSWPNSMFGNTAIQCVALCEVIDYHKGGKKQYTAKPYYVIPDEAHVLTRYLFCYTSVRANVAVNANQIR